MKPSRRSIGLIAVAIFVVPVAMSLLAWGPLAGSLTPHPPPTLAAVPSEVGSPTAGSTQGPSSSSSGAVLVGAGDICQVLRLGNARQTAALVEALLREIAATLVQPKKRGDHP